METHTKELLFIKVKNCSAEDKQDIFQMAQVFEMDVVDIGRKSVLLQCVHTEKRVDRLIEIFSKQYPNNIIVVRSGAVTFLATVFFYKINFVPQFGQKFEPALFGVPQFGQNFATLPPPCGLTGC